MLAHISSISTFSSLPYILPAMPEIFLSCASIFMLLIGAFKGNAAKKHIDILAVIVVCITFFLIVRQPDAISSAFYGAFRSDYFSKTMKLLILFGLFSTIVMSSRFLEREKLAKFEFTILLLLSTVGMMIMVSADELLSLYLGVELQSLALYVLASFNRDDRKSTEAGLKYFVLGALSSGMLLYGMSFIYGYTGSISYSVIANILSEGHNIGIIVGLVFLIAGLAFKMSVVPFHMWTPDVYEGAPTPVTAFFATAPKVAAVAMTLRIFIEAFPNISHEWRPIITFISIASMGIGAFAAIGQKNLKRLIAYSSIGNMGYAMMGLATGSLQGITSVIIFMIVYLFMSVGVFALLLSIKVDGKLPEDIKDLAGVSRSNPVFAFSMATILFSLVGIPPLGGFFSKFYVFSAVVEANMFPLVVIGVIASVISAFYYLRVIKVMYFDEPVSIYKQICIENNLLYGAVVAFLIAFIFMGGFVRNAGEIAARSLF